MDRTPVTITRRYSDFDKLNTLLRRRFQRQLSTISFPKKMVMGNFKAETVAQRSRGFEQYLTHLFSLDAVRLSSEFGEFFYEDSMRKGYDNLVGGRYDDAIPSLQNVVNVEKKILGCNHANVILTLCALAACHDALEQNKAAQTVADAALCCIGDDDKHPCLVPLLNLSIRQCWKLGKNKTDLETRLHSIQGTGLSDDTDQPGRDDSSLLDIVIKQLQTKHRR